VPRLGGPFACILSIMSSSTKVDVNYISCSNGVWGMNEGGPNPTSCAPLADGAVLTPANPTSYASILKLCDNSTVTLKGLVVEQGSEGSVDINNHATVNLQGTFGNSAGGGNQIFSIKGQSSAVIAGTLKGSGNRQGADLVCDEWSDQAYGGSSVDLTNAKHETGRKLVVVKRYGASNVTLGLNAQVAVLPSIELTAYWWLKWTVRKVTGIKVGQKGPSWL